MTALKVEESAVGFRASEVQLAAGAAVLVGINSAGKSRLLREAYRSVSDPSGRFAVLSMTGPNPSGASYVDLGDLVERQQSFFRHNQFGDLVEQAGFTSFRKREVRAASFLVGRSYVTIEVAEIDNTNADLYVGDEFAYRPDVLPYFRVESYSRLADSIELSRGELAVLTSLWVMKQAPRSEIFFWDEPDSFLSPASSGRLLSAIADWSNERKLPTLVSSHSYLGLATIPIETQVMVRIDSEGLSRITSSSESDLWTTLRISAPKKVVFIVEDRMARALLERLLAEIGLPDLDSVDIWMATDSDGVVLAAKFAEKASSSIRFIAVLDGDSRDILTESDRLLSLPWNVSPEVGAIAILEADSSFLGASSERCLQRLETTQGVDAHDRVVDLAESVGRNVEAFVVDCWMEWLRNEPGADEMRRFADSCFQSLGLTALPQTDPTGAWNEGGPETKDVAV